VTSDILAGLNPAQRQAVEAINGPVLILAGRGTLYTYAVYHRAYHPGFADDIPYVTAVVALDEGPHLLSNLVGYTPDALKCDMPLLVVWEDITPDFALPKFRPA